MYSNSKILFPVLLIIFCAAIFLAYYYSKYQPERDAQKKYKYEHSTEYVKKHNQEELESLHQRIDSINKEGQLVKDSLNEDMKMMQCCNTKPHYLKGEVHSYNPLRDTMIDFKDGSHKFFTKDYWYSNKH